MQRRWQPPGNFTGMPPTAYQETLVAVRVKTQAKRHLSRYGKPLPLHDSGTRIESSHSDLIPAVDDSHTTQLASNSTQPAGQQIGEQTLCYCVRVDSGR